MRMIYYVVAIAVLIMAIICFAQAAILGLDDFSAPMGWLMTLIGASIGAAGYIHGPDFE